MRLSLCLNSATGDLCRPDAMQYAKKLGYTAVEFWEGKNFDIDAYKVALTDLELPCMGFASGLTDPANRNIFLEDVKTSFSNAQALGAKGIIVTTGDALEGVTREKQFQSIVAGLRDAAKVVDGSGIAIYLEPLNVLVNHPGHYLHSSAEAFEILREVNSPNVKLLFDIYHQQISEGNLITNITQNIDLIGHMHAAGNPGRIEPYLGEINYSEVFAAVKDAGYAGYVGLEFWSSEDCEKSLLKCLELYS